MSKLVNLGSVTRETKAVAAFGKIADQNSGTITKKVAPTLAECTTSNAFNLVQPSKGAYNGTYVDCP